VRLKRIICPLLCARRSNELVDGLVLTQTEETRSESNGATKERCCDQERPAGGVQGNGRMRPPLLGFRHPYFNWVIRDPDAIPVAVLIFRLEFELVPKFLSIARPQTCCYSIDRPILRLGVSL